MVKDSPPLRLVGQRAASPQLESRKEIDDWLAERKQALDALARREQLRLGEEVGS
jgi:hypothetical protein